MQKGDLGTCEMLRMLGIQGRGSCHSLSCLFGFEQRSFEWWLVDAELAKEKCEAYGKGEGVEWMQMA